MTIVLKRRTLDNINRKVDMIEDSVRKPIVVKKRSAFEPFINASSDFIKEMAKPFRGQGIPGFDILVKSATKNYPEFEKGFRRTVFGTESFHPLSEKIPDIITKVIPPLIPPVTQGIYNFENKFRKDLIAEVADMATSPTNIALTAIQVGKGIKVASDIGRFAELRGEIRNILPQIRESIRGIVPQGANVQQIGVDEFLNIARTNPEAGNIVSALWRRTSPLQKSLRNLATNIGQAKIGTGELAGLKIIGKPITETANILSAKNIIEKVGGVIKGIADKQNSMYEGEETIYFDDPSGSTHTLPVSKINEANVKAKFTQAATPTEGKVSAGGMTTGRQIPETMKKWMEKGVTVTHMGEIIKITEPETQIKNVEGKMVDLPKGHEMRAYYLSNGNVWLHDGKDVIVNKNQLKNLANKNLVLGGEFAPELSQVEEVVKGVDEIKANLAKREFDAYASILAKKYNLNSMHNLAMYKTIKGMTNEEVAKYEELQGKWLDLKDKTKFGQYQLPGGKNYREVLIKAPETIKDIEVENTIKDLQKEYNITRKQAVEGIKSGNYQVALTSEQRKNLEPIIQAQFTSSHWDEPNILAHLRVNDRTTPEGKKVYFIEELQSDWAAEGRKKGFKSGELGKEQKDRITVLNKQLSDIEEQQIENDREIRFLSQLVGESKEQRAELKQRKQLHNDLMQAFSDTQKEISNISQEGKIPFNPLLKNWQELALKKAIKEAVEGGYDYIAWTTGEQQAERYDLAKSINSIQWHGSNNNKFVRIEPKDEGLIRFSVDEYGVIHKDEGASLQRTAQPFIGKKLDEVVGKGLAEKILSKNEDTISGEGLKLGGEWAKNLYDRQVPNILKDLTGGEVENINVNAPGKEEWSVRDTKTGDLLSVYDSKEMAKASVDAGHYAGQNVKIQRVHKPIYKLTQPALKITPEIKQMVIGQPMAGGMVPPKEPLPTAVGQPEPESQGKQRGFITNVNQQFGDRIHGEYIPRSTDELAIKAKNFVKDDILAAEKIALEGDIGEGLDREVAIIDELIKEYYKRIAATQDPIIKNALHERVEEIVKKSGERLTNYGRAVQAAYILSLQTPEGQLRFAQKLINKFNQKIEESKGGLFGLRKKIPDLNKEQIEFIHKEMTDIKLMPEGFDKALKFQNLQNYIKDLVPSSLYDKIIALWKAGILTGLKTTGVNVLSNTTHFALEALKDIPGMGVDSIIGLFTKDRTLAFTFKSLQGIKEGFQKGWRYLKTGYDERNIGLKLDYHRVNFGKSKIAKALQIYEEKIFGLLGAEDQPFYYGAKTHSLYSQAIAKAQGKGLKGKEYKEFVENIFENPTDEMVRNAVLDAETCVFQNQTILGKIARKIQEAPGGQIVVPFGRTPSAIAMQIINYSPVGIVKTIANNIGQGKFNQRDFSQGIGRGITGLAILFLGGLLIKNKMMNLDRPTSEKEQKLWELEGRIPNTIKVGDKWRSIQILGPAGNLLLIGGHFAKNFKESGSLSEAMIKSLTGSVKSFTEQTFLTGISQLADALNDPQRSAEGYLNGLVGSLVPTIFADVARGIDINERRKESIFQSIQLRIPFARQMLEPIVDVLGKEKARVGNFMEVMADPTRPSLIKATPVIQELRRLWELGYKISPTLLGDKKGFKSLTPQQNTELWKQTGQIMESKLNNLIKLDNYKLMSDEEKSKLIENIIDKTKIKSRAMMTLELTDNLKGNDLKNKLGKLKNEKFITREVFKEYMNLLNLQDDITPIIKKRIIKRRILQ